MTPRHTRFFSDHGSGLAVFVLLIFRVSLFAIPIASGTVIDRTEIQNRKEPSNLIAEWILPSSEVLLHIKQPDGSTARIWVPNGDQNQPGDPYQYHWNHKPTDTAF